MEVLAATVSAIISLLAIGAAVVLYLLPAIVARQRNTPGIRFIVVINILVGWTFVGWVVALAMALGGPRRVRRVPPG